MKKWVEWLIAIGVLLLGASLGGFIGALGALILLLIISLILERKKKK